MVARITSLNKTFASRARMETCIGFSPDAITIATKTTKAIAINTKGNAKNLLNHYLENALMVARITSLKKTFASRARMETCIGFSPNAITLATKTTKAIAINTKGNANDKFLGTSSSMHFFGIC